MRRSLSRNRASHCLAATALSRGDGCRAAENEVPLAWSSAFTLADLMEVVVALHTLGAVRKPNGTPVTFKDLVRAFERFLNVSILNPDRCRYTTINRKLHLTKFLDTMREALVELSQR